MLPVTLMVVLAYPAIVWADGPNAPVDEANRVASNASVSLDDHAAVPDRSAEQDSAATENGHDRMEVQPSATTHGDAGTVLIPRTTATPNARAAPRESNWIWLTSGVVPLLLVLGAIGVVYWAVRRWMPAARTADRGVLNVVARAAVTPKHSVALVHVGRRFVLVGVSGDRMERLESIGDGEEVADLLAATRPAVGAADPFIDALESESRSYGTAVEDYAEPEGERSSGAKRPSEQLSALLGRLRRLQKS